jgi:hypothetical protein
MKANYLISVLRHKRYYVPLFTNKCPCQTLRYGSRIPTHGPYVWSGILHINPRRWPDLTTDCTSIDRLLSHGAYQTTLTKEDWPDQPLSSASVHCPAMPLDLYAFINKHLKFKKAVDYGDGGAELLELVEVAKLTMCRQGDGASIPLIDVPIPVNIIGDIHGQFFDLQRIFLSLGLPGAQRYLFLGGKYL